MQRTLARTLAAVLLPAVVLAACGNDDDDAAADAGDAGIRVTAVDYGYEGLPASVPAGTRIKLMNDAKTEVHELVAIRLPDDEVRLVEEIFQLPPEELDKFLATAPATALVAPPGARRPMCSAMEPRRGGSVRIRIASSRRAPIPMRSWRQSSSSTPKQVRSRPNPTVALRTSPKACSPSWSCADSKRETIRTRAGRG